MVDMSDQWVSGTLYLSIASLHFKIFCRDLPIISEKHISYQPFLAATPREKNHFIPVHIHIGDIPKVKTYSKIFKIDQSWEMYKDSRNRYLFFYSSYGEKQKPITVAKFQPRGKEVDVYCSPELTSEIGNGRMGLQNPVMYPLDQLLLIYFLAGRGLLFHAAGAIINNNGYLFAGPSGAGKSTISRLFLQHDHIELINDDRVVVEKSDDGFVIHGTPWPGEAGITANRHARLKGIFFLQHAEKNMIRKLNPREAMARLFQVTSIPWYDQEILESGPLALCDKILSGVPIYELCFQPEKVIITMLEEFI